MVSNNNMSSTIKDVTKSLFLQFLIFPSLPPSTFTFSLVFSLCKCCSCVSPTPFYSNVLDTLSVVHDNVQKQGGFQ